MLNHYHDDVKDGKVDPDQVCIASLCSPPGSWKHSAVSRLFESSEMRMKSCRTLSPRQMSEHVGPAATTSALYLVVSSLGSDSNV